ncbi:MAG TPA: RHS repeat-associated core domain-containing protein [Solirubrobacterales bacterium]
MSALIVSAAAANCGTEFAAEEGYGLENPAAPNLIHACTGDPIDCATGNLVESQTDVSIDGRGPALELIRTYNAQLAAGQKEAGRFGYGWTGSYGAYLVLAEEAKSATVHHDNGSTVAFTLSGGKYVAGPWVQSTLVKEGESYVYKLPDQTTLTFSSAGKLTKVADRHGNALTLTYDGKGQLETVADTASRKLTFAYNVGGQVESVKDPMGNVVKYGYESGNLVSVTLPGKETARWKFKYDASHHLTELTDGRGNTTKNEYDVSHRVTAQIDPLERKRTLEYKKTEGAPETTITEPNGSKTVEKFNSAGEPLSITRASGTSLAQTTSFAYDASFNLTGETDANKHTTTFGYDGEGNRTSEKDANGNEFKWTYNSTHDVKTVTTPKGQTTTFVRNAAGDPETIERPGPGATVQKYTFKYAKNGDLESETDPLSRTTTFEYDSYGNVKARTNPEGDKRTWTYNEDSYLISEVSPRGNQEGAEASKFETKFERDAQGRALTITNPLGDTTKYAYDGNGNVETETDGNNRTTTYTYDKANQLTKVKAPNGDTKETGYSSMGQVVSRTDGNANTRKYERNALGQVTEEIDPLERKTTKEYDAAGNLKKVTDPESRTISYTYDAGDRLKEVNFSEVSTADVSYEYDKDGNVTAMTDGTGTSKYTYDVLGRLTEVENGAKELVKYEYNLADEQTKVVYPNGKAVTRAFDKAGRLETVTDWLANKTSFGYNRNSALTAITYPAATGNKDEFEYDNLDQMKKVAMKKGAETLASVSYTRDKVGQVKTMSSTGLPGAAELEYTNDEKNRLTKAGATEFKYDAADNPTSVAATSYSYDKASQLEKGGGVSFSFDKLGNRTKATPEAGPATTYGYDQAGNLISVNRAAEGEVKKIEDAYAYDGNGLRASQTISGTKKSFAWDVSAGLPLLLSDGTNNYVYGPGGQPIAQIDAEGKVHYLHHDQLGSTRMLTNGSGEVKGAYSYKPYGAIEAQTGTVKTPLGFNGQYTNESTGLIYLRARTYDPVTAQFVSVDPLVAKTGEPYGYAADNPVNASDPAGLCQCEIAEQAQDGPLGPDGYRPFYIRDVTHGIDVVNLFKYQPPSAPLLFPWLTNLPLNISYIPPGLGQFGTFSTGGVGIGPLQIWHEIRVPKNFWEVDRYKSFYCIGFGFKF